MNIPGGSKRKMKHENINVICLIYLITWAFVPVFAYYTSGTIFRILYAAIVIIWFFTGLENIIKKNVYPVIGMFLFLFIMFIYYMIGYGDLSLLDFINYILLLSIGINSTLYINRLSFRTKKIVKRYILTCISVTVITTLGVLYTNPVAVRLLTSTSTANQVITTLEKSNVGSFDFIYGLVIVLPVLTYVASQKKEKTKKIFYLVLIMFSILCIFKSNFTTAYILLVIDILLYLFFKSDSIFGKITSVLLLIIFSIFGKDILGWYFNMLLENTTSIWSKTKLLNIINIINGNGTLSATTDRVELILRDVYSFIDSPFIGKGAFYSVGSSIYIGQHSQFLDELARYGLLGVIPLSYFIYSCIRQILTSINDKLMRNKFLIATVVFLMLGFLNPIFNDGILFFYFIVIPILIEERKINTK